MTIALSYAKYHQLLEANQHTSSDKFESGSKIPENIGQGKIQKFVFQNDLGLVIRDLQMRDRVILKNPPRQHPVELGFRLSGYLQDEYGNYLQAGQNILVGGLEPGGTIDCFKPQNLLEISIYAELQHLERLIGGSPESYGLALKQFFHTIQKEPYFLVNATTPAMQIPLRQILQCPYQGITKRLYLESKTLELIALTLEPLLNRCQRQAATLNQRDRDKIHLARERLLEQLADPPSLKTLAQEAGCNEYKLKQGFRELFGTTVFGYLHNHRMECAQLLLMKENVTITEVACAVGYNSISAFSTAFRKKFGISPKSYWQSYL
ncbi:MAG: helix-turn-helix domain-containing protein [Cyanobacteria bacterium]|jgi:AraC-like DNA-binding protein|nr:helix-turn-helix domain-containing protein [Cyanobacteria bacterium GSL.Bin1]